MANKKVRRFSSASKQIKPKVPRVNKMMKRKKLILFRFKPYS